MKSNPHRPLILKRRKPPLLPGDPSTALAREDSGGRGNGSLSHQQARTREHSPGSETPGTQQFPSGEKLRSRPAASDTQALAISAGTDAQAIVEALAAHGNNGGSSRPNQCTLISSDSHSAAAEAGDVPQLLRSEDKPHSPCRKAQEEGDAGPSSGARKGTAVWALESQSMEGEEQAGNRSREAPSCSLDNSLTNIQWLGNMSSSDLSPCRVKEEMEKENQTPHQEGAVEQIEEGPGPSSSTASWPKSFMERPPYSYMAMIQFAINSTEKKRMTLKDIYTWIEDHFPYFKHVAKPGWKNSIRHNLSLHDMFVRETPANSKISFWTIHPEANRYLTLDQVFKQQKRHPPALQQGSLGGVGGDKTGPPPARHKMKLLLPRVNSYLVPVQFPLSPALITLPVPQGMSELVPSCKRVRIAPKVLPTSVKPTLLLPEISIKEEVCGEEESSSFASLQPTQEDACQIHRELFPAAWPSKKERDAAATPSQPGLPVEEPPVPWDEEPPSFLPGPEKQMRPLAALRQPSQETLDPERYRVQEMSRSRRKQHLGQPHQEEEPVLLLPPLPPPSSGSESFILQHSFPFGEGGRHPPESISHLSCSQVASGPFTTPTKEMLGQLPASSSTPSRMVTDPWRLVPFVKETSAQDCGPSGIPPMPLLALQQNLDLGPSMFDSPQPLLLNAGANDVVLGQLRSSPASSNPSPPELQASVPSGNCSLQEGLFLDTMNESLSKILLDASFPGFDEDSLAADLSWSGSFLV